MFAAVGGDDITIPIPLGDLKSTFSGLFESLITIFKEVDAPPAAEEPPVNYDSDDPTPLPEGHTKWRSSSYYVDPSASILGGMNIALLPNDQIKVKVDFDADYFNKMMFTTFESFFKSLSLGDVAGVNPDAVTYNNTTAGTFFNSFFTNIIEPVFQAEAGSNWILVSSGVKTAFQSLLRRLFPFPNLASFSLEANIMQGELAYIDIVGPSTASGQYLNGKLYNNTAGTFDGAVIDWGRQPNIIVYDPLAGKTLASYFSTTAYLHQGQTHTTANISWNYSSVVNVNVPGTYTVTGTAHGRSLTVTHCHRASQKDRRICRTDYRG